MRPPTLLERVMVLIVLLEDPEQGVSVNHQLMVRLEGIIERDTVWFIVGELMTQGLIVPVPLASNRLGFRITDVGVDIGRRAIHAAAGQLPHFHQYVRGHGLSVPKAFGSQVRNRNDDNA